jgi:hypothetical protein
MARHGTGGARGSEIIRLGQSLQPGDLIEIAVKAGDVQNAAIATGEGEQGIVEVEFAAKGNCRYWSES